MGFVQKFVDRYSTIEADATTPRRNMFYGFGYAAASIDRTAAAFFVVFLATLGPRPWSPVWPAHAAARADDRRRGDGRPWPSNDDQRARRATGMIKLVGSWMMIMAGVG